MPLLYVRAIAPYEPGANASDVIINQIHFNRTALDHYNYTLYTNGTLSNGSNCYLALQHFRPYMFPTNGSFVNGTSCYAPIHPVSRHASAGMAFALMFMISLLFSLANVRKHSRLFLAVDKRWNPLGRRCKWYWLLGLGVCGTIGCFMSIDVDRDHVQSAPLVIQSVFYSLLTPVMLAAVWETVRNWGTFQERQVYNRDPLAFNIKTTREHQERVLPLVFYFFAVITFFLSIGRSWSTIELQRDPQQQALRAKPFATDSRFQAAGFFALVAVLVIIYSLGHSIYRYIPRPLPQPGYRRRSWHLRQLLHFYTLQGAPPQLALSIILLLVKVAYDIAAAFTWPISPLRFGVHPGWIYGLGYTPALLLIALFDVCGMCEMNEDKTLIAQRVWIETALAGEEGVGRGRWSKWRWSRRGRGRGRGRDDGHNRPVEMHTITPRSDGKPVDNGIQVTTAPATPIRTDSQPSQTVNPFSSGPSSSSGNRSSSDNDSLGFVADVLSSLDQAGWDREAHE